MAEQVLQERVLALLGRARVGLQAEHLLAGHRSEQFLQPVGLEATERSQCLRREGLAQHGRVAEQPPLFGREPVEARRDERMKGLRHLERPHLADNLVGSTVLDQ